MDDLHERLRRIERNPSPDLWDEITSRTAESSPVDRHSSRHRVAAGLVAAVVSIAALVFLVSVFRTNDPHRTDAGGLGDVTLLVSSAGPSGDSALLTGSLTIDSGCVAVSGEPGSYVYVVWPAGYSLAGEGGETWLFDDSGNQVAAIGDQVQMGGGITNLAHAEPSVLGGIPSTCEVGGPDAYWFAGTPELVSRSSPGETAEIVLPPLPDSGIAAMWSRENSVGVSFVNLEGEVVATVRNAIIYRPGGPPGTVVLVRGENRHWVLDARDHVLRSVSESEANQIVNGDRGPFPPTPANSVGDWAWVEGSPDGTETLGQYWQSGYGSQLSECSKPIAMIQRPSSGDPEPITGQSLGQPQPTYALGWASAGHPLAAVMVGPCGSPLTEFAEGVHVFDEAGGHERVNMPAGSYSFQMWTTS